MPAALPLSYIRPFDGVRALAVSLVVLMHWPLPHFSLPFGWAGVNLFFVLSGLLITRILVSNRGTDGKRASLSAYLRRFYVRRVLRIFPLYYLYLALAGTLALYAAGQAGGVVAVRAWRTDGLLLLTYLQNWRAAIHGLGGPDRTAYGDFFNHLWSLAVEEQFYLFYPLLVWALPPRRLRVVLWVVVLATPLLRAAAGEWLRQPGIYLGRAGWLLVASTPSHADALALGGLLALGAGQQLRAPGRWLVAAGLLALAWNAAHLLALRQLQYAEMPPWSSLGFDQPLRQFRYAPAEPVWLRVRWAFTFSWVNGLSALLLLWAAARGALVRRLFENRPAVFVGRISYGLYVWHFAPVLLVNSADVRQWVGGSGLREALALAIYVGGVLLIASLSYFGYENRFLKLKERFAGVSQ